MRSFLAAEAAGRYVRAMADDPRGFTDEVWDQVVGARLAGPARTRGARRPGSRARRHGRGDGGDGPAAVAGPVLLVGGAGDARGARRSAPTTCSRRSRRARSGARLRSRSGPRRARSIACARAPAARAPTWVLTGDEAARARRSHGRLGDRRGPHRGRARHVPARSARRRARPDARPDPQGGAARARRDAGRSRRRPRATRPRSWRRVVDDAARDALRRDGRRDRRRARARGRVRQGARPVRPADRDVPGDPAQGRRHAAPARARARGDALRRVDVRRRRSHEREPRGRDGEGLSWPRRR